MIDRDGYARPDKPDEHLIGVPHKKSKYKISKNTYFSKNPFYIVGCMLLRLVALIALSFIGKFILRARAKGKKNYRLAKKTGAVIVCNHVHYFDVVLVASQFSPIKKVWITTLQENMDIPVGGLLARMLGAIPIPDEMRQLPTFIKAVDYRLSNKGFVAIMPETALWPYYREVRPFKISAFRFAAKNNVPVLPVALSFIVKKKMLKDGKTKLKYKLHYDYLPPIYPNAQDSVAKNAEDMMVASNKSMKEIVELRNKQNFDKYGV